MTANERVIELERVLENLLDCFDTGGEVPQVYLVNGESASVDVPTEKALTQAADVLYNEAYGDGELSIDSDTYEA